MRTRAERIGESWADSRATYRIVEADGSVCDCWLPGVELSDPEGPLDRGGFDIENDARAFACGVNWERAYHRMLEGVTTADIDRERARLDVYQKQPDTLEALAAKQLRKFAEPVVEHRRPRVA